MDGRPDPRATSRRHRGPSRRSRPLSKRSGTAGANPPQHASQTHPQVAGVVQPALAGRVAAGAGCGWWMQSVAWERQPAIAGRRSCMGAIAVVRSGGAMLPPAEESQAHQGTRKVMMSAKPHFPNTQAQQASRWYRSTGAHQGTRNTMARSGSHIIPNTGSISGRFSNTGCSGGTQAEQRSAHLSCRVRRQAHPSRRCRASRRASAPSKQAFWVRRSVWICAHARQPSGARPPCSWGWFAIPFRFAHLPTCRAVATSFTAARNSGWWGSRSWAGRGRGEGAGEGGGKGCPWECSMRRSTTSCSWDWHEVGCGALLPAQNGGAATSSVKGACRHAPTCTCASTARRPLLVMPAGRGGLAFVQNAWVLRRQLISSPPSGCLQGAVTDSGRHRSPCRKSFSVVTTPLVTPLAICGCRGSGWGSSHRP